MTTCSNATKYDTVIFHKNCLDGLASAWVYRHYNKSKKVNYIPEVPSSTSIPPNTYGKKILILDVSYQLETLHQLANDANCLLLIDHHISNQKSQDSLPYTRFNLNNSACVATWHYFFPNKKIPLFLKLIEANDLGQFHNKDAMCFNSYLLYLFPKVSFKYIHLFDQFTNINNTLKGIKLGKPLYLFTEQIINRNTKHQQFQLYFNGQNLNVCVGNVTTVPLKGRIATRILDENSNCDLSMVWALDNNIYSVVVRTKKDNIDASLLAQYLSKGEKAGGHQKAAHFFYKGENIYDLFN
jgi:oligoribonuclease NrnB/cAMP/cGMP phosphodiesterase (DHH superfamily)